MTKKILTTLLLAIYVFGFNSILIQSALANSNTSGNASNVSVEEFSTLSDVNRGTFNEYRYHILNEYFSLKNGYETSGKMNLKNLENMAKYAKTGYNYLQDSLINKNILNDFLTSLKKAYQEPNSEVNYLDVISKMDAYIKNVRIQKVVGAIRATPSTGNAPLNVTLTGDVRDPTGTILRDANYTWWVDVGGKKVVIGNKRVINYTFKEESTYTVFLDVKSSHKNSLGYTDVLPFSSRVNIVVNAKIASIILKVNSDYLRNYSELKFTPEESNYGLIFDATASTPTGGAKFTKTEWDFGNGVIRKYDGEPKLERVVYSKEGNFPVVLKLVTNQGKTIERKFNIAIHNPIATIDSAKENGFIGEQFTFTAKPGVTDKNLSYSWNVIDVTNDKVLTKKAGSILNYVFSEKGSYVVQLEVKDAAGNLDIDKKNININSRPPIANFNFSVPFPSKPNTILLDGTKSFDHDYSDQGKLKYIWTIDGEVAQLDNLDAKGAIGYYTFDSIGDHSVNLEVIDTDGLNSFKSSSVKISSILTADFTPFPRVIKVGSNVKFVASSPEAKYYEWDFGDGEKITTTDKITNYSFKSNGNFDVRLVVRDSNGLTNEVRKKVYVGNADNPVAVIDFTKSDTSKPIYDRNACSYGAYIIDRVSLLSFNGTESINIDGNPTGLSYSWKIGNDKIFTGKNVNYKFDELGCYQVKLTATSDENGKSSTDSIWVKVENLKPQMTTLNIQPVNLETDPVIVNLQAVGAQDPDGVIQSYLWYYYTDTDPEPQDYRITTQPSTSFVLPKITGNYYFVVVMKDNNDVRYSSKEGDSSSYFISLTGDNINTPLIDLKVNKNSVNVGDEIIFSSTVKNVLGTDISNKVEYTWDFDGDGFYDKETNIGNISHVYKSSGSFYAKLRVKYKGMTNVRTVEINVANILKPDFEYISIGNKYLIFNTSKGQSDAVVFDMGDGNKVTDKNYFEYSFENDSSSREVLLRITEGTKIKETTKTLLKDMKNLISSKTSTGTLVYSYPNLSGNKITILEKTDKVVLYVSNKSQDYIFNVDNDLALDSDLNGSIDDDVDNKDLKGGFIEIPLNESKNQMFRISTYNGQELVESKDFVITKEYIEETDIDINSIDFTGVTENEKVKIEKLKSFVDSLPKENRLQAMNFVQRLQEEWFYETEKTKVILDFTKYIDSLALSNGADIIELLESLLVQGQQDQSIRNMSYNVVKNLIPKELVDYNDLILNLDSIKENPSKVEENRVLGKEILESIKTTSLIRDEDKLMIKSQLQVLIYGSVENIPTEVKQEVKTQEVKESGTSKILGVFVGVIKAILYIVLLFIALIFVFFIWYKLTNKNENLGFQDFIIEKTNGSKKPKQVENSPVVQPVVEKKVETKAPEVKPEAKVEKTNIQPTKNVAPENKKAVVPDWLKSSGVVVKEEELKPKTETKAPEVKLEVKTEAKAEAKTPEKAEEVVVPDWLKPQSETKTPEVKPEVKAEAKTPEKAEEVVVPDWLKPQNETKTPEVKPEVKAEAKAPEKAEEVVVPDWLKPKTETKAPEPKPEVKAEVKAPEKAEEVVVPDWLKPQTETKTPEVKPEVKAEAKAPEKTEDVELPDWLKPKVEAKAEPKAETKKVETKAETKKVETKAEAKKVEPKAEAKKVEPKAETKKVEVKTETKKVEPKAEAKKIEVKAETKKAEPKAETKKAEPKAEAKKAEPKAEAKKAEPKAEAKKVEPKAETKKAEPKAEAKKTDELWGDGMDIPDWLKSDNK